MTQSDHLQAAKLMIAAEVNKEFSVDGKELSWNAVKALAGEQLKRFAMRFGTAEQVVRFIAENGDIMKEMQRHVGPEGAPLWELVQEAIPAFVFKRLSDDLQDMFAEQFDTDIDPVGSLRKLGLEVATAWEQGSLQNPIALGQAATLRKELAADDLDKALRSLQLVVSHRSSLQRVYGDVLQRVADVYALRDAFDRVKTRPTVGMTI